MFRFVFDRVDWLIEWYFTPLSTVSQSKHGHSSHYSYLSWISAVLGWGSNVLPKDNSHEKLQRIQWGSNPGPLDYESHFTN